MISHTSLDDFSRMEDAVLALGMFDGVHLAHRDILRHLTQEARRRNGVAVVLSFDPHPREVLTGRPFPLIVTQREKRLLLEECGVDIWCCLPFTSEFSALSPEALLDRLSAQMHLRHMVLGYNHHFGHRKEGSVKTLRALQQKYGFGVTEVPQRSEAGEAVSSTAIRQALQQGDIARASRLLGYPFFAFVRPLEKQDANTWTASVPPEKLLPETAGSTGRWQQQRVYIHLSDNKQLTLRFEQAAPDAEALQNQPLYWNSL